MVLLIKIKDNVHRCPWCGNFVPIKNIGNFVTNEKHCLFCNHHCIRKVGKYTLFLILISCLLVILLSIRTYIILPLSFLIEYALAYFDLKDPFVKSIKSNEKSLPTKGYKVKISLLKGQLKRCLLNNMVIPIVFISETCKPVSSICCVRIENGKWVKGFLECDLKLLEFGKVPQEETNKIYLYNKGELIASGIVISQLPISY